MTHEEAVRNQTAAAYLLGDLPEAERDAFEEHYFDCRECGGAVRAGAAMFAGGREVVRNESSFRRFRPLKSVLSGAAAAAAIVVVTYQTAVIPRVQSLAAPPAIEVARPTDLVTSEMRGETKPEQVIDFNGETLALYREIPDEPQRFPRYQVELRTAAGDVLSTADVSEEHTQRLFRTGESISIAVRPLPAGRYELVILGVREDGNRLEVGSSFVVVQ